MRTDASGRRARPLTTRDIARRRRRRVAGSVLAFFFLLGLVGFAIPGVPGIPVEGASHLDWNQESFWYLPSDGSSVHKGIDITAASGTPVITATPGLVLYTARLEQGGDAVAVLGPKWRVHYYAHLQKTDLASGLVSPGTVLGTVADTGTDGGAARLHYSIVTLVPYPWRIGRGPEGWKKMFYLDPSDELAPSEPGTSDGFPRPQPTELALALTPRNLSAS